MPRLMGRTAADGDSVTRFLAQVNRKPRTRKVRGGGQTGCHARAVMVLCPLAVAVPELPRLYDLIWLTVKTRHYSTAATTGARHAWMFRATRRKSSFCFVFLAAITFLTIMG